MEEQRDQMWTRLENWQKNAEIGMSKDKYLEIQAQLGQEPDPERCPPGDEDLPEIIINSIEIFNLLGDRVYPEIGYIGKDYTNLPLLMKLYNIDNVEILMEALSRLDAHAIKKSQEELKREYDKLKRKSRG